MKVQVPKDCLLGCHISISGGLEKVPERARDLGCTTGQIFTSSNRRWAMRDLGDDEVEDFIEGTRTLPGGISAHACYLINLAKDETEPWEKSVRTLAEEVRRADRLDIPYLVLHPGSHVGSGEENGIERVSEALDRVHEETPEASTKILLETMAGQGTGLGYRMEQLAEMREGTRNPDRLGYCLDTCHMFAGGYDLTTEQAYENTMEKVETVLGRDRVMMVHLNDSKGELDSRVDRHEHIGKGMIGEEAFRFLMNDSRWNEIPKILETPVDDDWAEDYGANMQRLIDLIE